MYRLRFIVSDAKTYSGVKISTFCLEYTSPTKSPKANGENSNSVALEKKTNAKKKAAYFIISDGLNFKCLRLDFTPSGDL